MLKDTICVNNIEDLNFFYLTRFIDIVYGCFGELNHVDHPALTQFWIIAYPVKEIEFGVNLKTAWPACDNLSCEEAIDRYAFVSGGIV